MGTLALSYNKLPGKGRYFIYALKCRKTLKLYIGSTINLKGRVGKHMSLFRHQSHPNALLQEHYDRFGEEGFQVVVFEEVPQEEYLYPMEDHYVRLHKSLSFQGGLNLSEGIMNSTGRKNNNFGNKWNEDTRANVSEIVKARFADPVYREKMQPLWEKTGERTAKFWAENPDKKQGMAEKVAEKKQELRFYQMDNQGSILNSFDKITELQEYLPGARWNCVYNSANGYTRRHKKFYWVSVLNSIDPTVGKELVETCAEVWLANKVENRVEVIKFFKRYQKELEQEGVVNYQKVQEILNHLIYIE